MTDLRELFEPYKEWLRSTLNRDELYKWEAVKHFQDTWNLEADDFYGMLKASISKCGNLMFKNSRGFILLAARYKTEEVRSLFRNLFDESKDLDGRMKAFTAEAEALREEVSALSGKKLASQQDERTLALYLSLKYPDRHYLYKNSYYQEACAALGEPVAKAGGKYLHFMRLVEKLKKEYSRELAECVELHRATLTPSCYSGDGINLVLQNILFVMLQRKAAGSESAEIRSDATWWLYAPGQGARFWEQYSDEGVMGIGGEEIGDLSRFQGKGEIAQALRDFNNKPEASFKNDALAYWEFSHVIKPGDVVVVKRGLREYLGIGIVESEYRFESEREEYCNIRSVRWIRKGVWSLDEGPFPLKTLTNITPYKEWVERIRSALLEGKVENPAPNSRGGAVRPRNYILYGPPGTGKTYRTVEHALALLEDRPFESYEGESRDELRRRFDEARKGGRIEFITFHQSYSYEEFVEGIRPKAVAGGLSYDVEPGIFRTLCDTARKTVKPHVLVIDEINRGNVARIFGELITLIEDDKREGASESLAVKLPYSGDTFTVPSNLFLVGTMNTADRSVEALDAALRRRFSFVEVMPNASVLAGPEMPDFEVDLTLLLDTMNRRIVRLLDRDHQIGHAYFLGVVDADDPLESLRGVFRDRVLPLLKEYFYSDPGKIGLVLGKAFVERVEDGFAFAEFDADAADRYSDRREYRFTDSGRWTMNDFVKIYAAPED